MVNSLSLSGTIEARGGTGEHGKISGGASPGGGGGGAGGSLFLAVKTVDSSQKGSLLATGGTGGKGSEAGSSVTYGGKGGVGRIRLLSKTGITATPASYTKCP